MSALKTDVAGVKADVAGVKTDIGTLQTDVSGVKGSVATLSNSSVMQLAPYVSVIDETAGPLVRLRGVNLQLVNGDASDPTNGKGNLILGYNSELAGEPEDRTGSHNLVVGRLHSYPGFESIVAGQDNTVEAGCTVALGLHNRATANFATVTGGWGNMATDYFASVSGGSWNVAGANSSSVSGGYHNTAGTEGLGAYSSVSGGTDNLAYGSESSVSGGQGGVARNLWNWCVGRTSEF